MAHVPHGMMRLQVVPKNPTVAVDALGQGTETFAAISGLAALPAYIEQMETAESVDDGGPAVEAMLGNLGDVKLAPDGGYYVLDASFNLIRRVDARGVITTTLGAAGWGYSGDGGPASAAKLRGPSRLRVARDGRLFVVDRGNRRVRLVSVDGIITTVAGDGRDRVVAILGA